MTKEETLGANNFWLVRDPEVYSGTYRLSTYLPKRSPSGAPAWYFFRSDDEIDFAMDVSTDDARRIEARLGNEVGFGEAVNLATGEVVRLSEERPAKPPALDLIELSVGMSGRDSSVLALLAQGKDMPPEEAQAILATLDGPALKIARALVGMEKRPSRDVKQAAEYLSSWARGL